MSILTVIFLGVAAVWLVGWFIWIIREIGDVPVSWPGGPKIF